MFRTSVAKMADLSCVSKVVGVCPLSPILFIMFMDKISWRSQGVEWFQFGGVRISPLLFVDDVVLLTPSGWDLQLSLELLAAECK